MREDLGFDEPSDGGMEVWLSRRWRLTSRSSPSTTVRLSITEGIALRLNTHPLNHLQLCAGVTRSCSSTMELGRKLCENEKVKVRANAGTSQCTKSSRKTTTLSLSGLGSGARDQSLHHIMSDIQQSPRLSPDSDAGQRPRSSSRSSSHRLSSASLDQSRKGKSVEGTSSNATADRPSFVSPPAASWRTSIQQIQRRPSASSGYFNLNSEPLPLKSGFLTAQNQSGAAADGAFVPSDRGSSSASSSQRNSLSDTATAQASRAIAARELERQSQPRVPTFSIGSTIMSTSWGSIASTASSLAGSEHGEDGFVKSPASSRPQSQAPPLPEPATRQAGGEDLESSLAGAQRPTSPTLPPIGKSQGVARKPASRATASRRLSGVTVSTTGTQSPNSDKGNSSSEAYLGVLGICALESKARSKPSRNILNRVNAHNEFDVVMFGDKIILDEEPENWPLCDYLISFFSEGFPLHKAIEYVRLRKPYSVNDLPMQTVLWDRRICLRILDRYKVLTPSRLEVVRDGGPRAETAEIGQHIFERTGLRLPSRGDTSDPGLPPSATVFMKDPDTLHVDGKELRKPFVEKPVSGEDHNIRIYYERGGGRRLFRKVNNKSSEADDSLNVPRCITDTESSYIYESFLSTQAQEDVKAYTVGPHFCHAETRKSPVVDGIVKRNTHGKEVRYVAELSDEEKNIASKISEAFGQRICGFDLLRANGKSFVIDVNGWSFVKDNNAYYDRCSEILRDLFVKEKLRKDGRAAILDGDQGLDGGLPNRPSGVHFSTLKSILRSPSVSRLTGYHHHQTLRQHGEASPELSSTTTPLISPPSIERPAGVRLPPPHASVPTLPVASKSVVPGAAPDASPAVTAEDAVPVVPPPAAKSQWRLKGMVAVIRHADRTPKQKFKFTFHTKPFVDLLKGHKEEVLLVGEAALNSVLDAVRVAFKEGVEDMGKLKQLQMALKKKGSLPGTKVQIKPMFRKKDDDKEKKKKQKEQEGPEDNDSSSQSDQRPPLAESPVESVSRGPLGMSDVRTAPDRKDSIGDMTLSRAAAAEGNLELEKLQLIVKWGGEPTHSARYQSQELGENLRADLLLMNRDALEDLKVFSSSERRVTTSAQIWTAAFLNTKEIPPNYVHIRKDLLDDSNAAKDEMDKVKKKLKDLLRKGNKAPEQFAWPENMPEPYLVARSVVELMQFHRRVMRENYAKLQGGAASSLAAAAKSGTAPLPSPVGLSETDIQARWCAGEDAALFKERYVSLIPLPGRADEFDQVGETV